MTYKLYKAALTLKKTYCSKKLVVHLHRKEKHNLDGVITEYTVFSDMGVVTLHTMGASSNLVALVSS